MGEIAENMEDEYRPLKGEGDVKFVKKTHVRHNCDGCGEVATKRYTFLLENARRNPQSAAYGRDDCTWLSDYELFGCEECGERSRFHALAPEGLSWCATFDLERFPHMGLYWHEKDIPDPTDTMKEMVEVLGELVSLMEAVISGDYRPDSFTCQPAHALLAKLGRE